MRGPRLIRLAIGVSKHIETESVTNSHKQSVGDASESRPEDRTDGGGGQQEVDRAAGSPRLTPKADAQDSGEKSARATHAPMDELIISQTASASAPPKSKHACV
jgi:hypothetical protein